MLTFLAHQAWLMLDAIVRTLFRLVRQRRRLLEWVTSAQSDSRSCELDGRSLAAQIAAQPAFAGARRALLIV